MIDHSHMERGGSKTHPVGPPAASCQHPVLIDYANFFCWKDKNLSVYQHYLRALDQYNHYNLQHSHEMPGVPT